MSEINKNLEELNINNIYIKKLLSKYYLDLNEQINLIMYIADLFNYKQYNKNNKNKLKEIEENNEIIKFILNKYSNLHNLKTELDRNCGNGNKNIFLINIDYEKNYQKFIDYIKMICENFLKNDRLNDNGYS